MSSWWDYIARKVDRESKKPKDVELRVRDPWAGVKVEERELSDTARIRLRKLFKGKP